MTHDRYSELLRGYVAGTLDDADRRAVEEHLEECSDCAGELAAVTALHAHAPAQPLSDVERARLHRTVLQEISLDPAALPARANGGNANKARLAGWLGAAALVVVVGMYVAMQGAGMPEDESGSAAGSSVSADALETAAAPEVAVTRTRIAEIAAGDQALGTTSSATADGAPDDAAAESSDSEDAEADDAGEADGGAAGGAGTGSGRVEGDALVLVIAPDAGAFDNDDLADFGRRAPGFIAARHSLSTDDVALAPVYLDALADAAPGSAASAIIVTCGEQMLAQGLPQLPVFAGFGKSAGRDVVVLGTVFRASGRGKLDRFSLWVWPQDSCEVPVAALSGRIAR